MPVWSAIATDRWTEKVNTVIIEQFIFCITNLTQLFAVPFYHMIAAGKPEKAHHMYIAVIKNLQLKNKTKLKHL